ncbi:hypothetical protein [Cryobacterium sp. Sr3]|nr:hypothetical protein [Cryobacterium sp. Sr3]
MPEPFDHAFLKRLHLLGTENRTLHRTQTELPDKVISVEHKCDSKRAM